MRTRRMLGLLGLLISGCAGPRHAPPSEPPAPTPQHPPAEVESTAPTAPAPSTAPKAPERPPPETATVTRPPAKAPGKGPPAAEAKKTESAARSDPTAPAAAPLDLKSLEAGLKNTNAIGFFTKVEIKNQVGDLVAEFREVHQGRSRMPVSELRGDFDRLVLKVLALVQDGDPRLASQIAASRESLWGILTNPQTFANR